MKTKGLISYLDLFFARKLTIALKIPIISHILVQNLQLFYILLQIMIVYQALL